MKRILLFTVVSLHASILFSQEECEPSCEFITNQEECEKVNDPYIWDGFCEEALGIERYLQRAVLMEDMAMLNAPIECYYAGPNDPNPSPPADAEVNCNAPYDVCASIYCPDLYCQQIEMLVDMNAQFIMRTVKAWSQVQHFQEEDGILYNAASQLVCDINSAYDCAGLSRPIIQAGIFEGVGDGIQWLTFDSEMVELFMQYTGVTRDQLPDDFFEDPLTRTTLSDDIQILQEDITSGGAHLDFNNIEAQFWMFYQAVSYINMGYTALHMGQFRKYYDGINDGYELYGNFLDAIRLYAENESEAGFVVLNGEAGNGVVESTGELLFDFSMVPVWFSEVDTPSDDLTSDNFDCEVSSDLLEGTPCQGDLDVGLGAYWDPCLIEYLLTENSGLEDMTGILPNGCSVENIPFMLMFDYGHGALVNFDDCSFIDNYDAPTITNPGGLQGIIRDADGNPKEIWGGSTYGFDDSRYFGNELSAECRQHLLTELMCGIGSQFTNGHMQIPGMLRVKFPENYCNDPDGIVPSKDGVYFLTDDQTEIVESVSNLLTPEPPQVLVRVECVPFAPDDCLPFCIFPTDEILDQDELFVQGRNKVSISVANADCVSEYSIHIKQPDGSWLPYTFDTNTEFFVLQNGIHQIRVRQDNLGFEQALNAPGVTTQTNETLLDLQIGCCEVVQMQDCPFSPFGDIKRTKFDDGGIEIEVKGDRRRLIKVENYDDSYEITNVNTQNNTFEFVVLQETDEYIFDIYSTDGITQDEHLIRVSQDDIESVNQETRNRDYNLVSEIDLFISPIPTNDIIEVNIKVSEKQDAFISISDMSGKIVYEENKIGLNSGDNLINLSTNDLNLVSGVYVMNVSNKSRSLIERRKFIVSK